MSTYLYDEELAKKFKSWYEGTDMHIYAPSDSRRLFEVLADESNDEPIKLPILAINRNGGFKINNVNKKPMSYEGFRLTDNIADKNAILYAIPITINYQLDIYTRYYQEADEFCRDLIFNIINHPTINVDIEYSGIKINHKSTLHISENVEDNSNVQERIISGNFTRLTLNLTMDDAYLWNIKLKNPAKIDRIIVTDDEENK